MPALLLSVRFHDGRYHGAGLWPPSPARLFQALIAGAARGQALPDEAANALMWLEGLDAPLIAAPPAHAGQAFRNYVPNNDLDAKGGDPAMIGEIRVPKHIRPHLFDPERPLIYAWSFADGADAGRQARAVCAIAEGLYQLGRGVDMAWAAGEILADRAEVEARLAGHGGVLWNPSGGGGGESLSCPCPGSLDSLTERFDKARRRFSTIAKGKKGRKTGLLFAQAPKPRFGIVRYDSPPTFLLFDIRKGGAFAPQPPGRIAALAETIGNLSAGRLKKSALSGEDGQRRRLIDAVFDPRHAEDGEGTRRIRITPLPSIGHAQAERSIRRVLVTVPPGCPLGTGDIAWAFSGLVLAGDPMTGEPVELVPAGDRAMLRHYGLKDAARTCLWRTVTPAALPEPAARRRIDPRRMRESAKGGPERARENAAAESAVRQALRHAGVDAPAQAIRVQREPFEEKGRRAEAFAGNARFAKERLWHVEVTFAEAIDGPLLIGDGRHLGLGLMAPVRGMQATFAFTVTDGLTDRAEPLALARALRRAVMARAQEKMRHEPLPGFFTGHAADGTPLRTGSHEHPAFVFDARRRRLLVVAPHVLARRDAYREERELHLPLLSDALAGLRELHAGPAGRLLLAPVIAGLPDDRLFAPSPRWRSVTPYRVTRHARLGDAAAALEADIVAECLRQGLPRPRIEVAETYGKPGLGLFGLARLTFRRAVAGPLILGRDRHFGGGLFEAEGQIADLSGRAR